MTHRMMNGIIKHFGKGIWGPSFEEPYRIVAAFLMDDVQRCVKSCDTYVFAALDVESGNQEPHEIGGNGNIVRLMPSWVLIGNIYDEDIKPQIISMDAFVAALRYWKSIVKSWDGKSVPVDPPTFTYDDPRPDPPFTEETAALEFKQTLKHW